MKCQDVIIPFLLLFLNSCDFYGTYEFQVANKLTKPITLEYSYHNGLNDTLVIADIQIDSIKTILIDGSENLGMNEKLHGLQMDTIYPFRRFKVKYNDEELQSDYRIGDKWTFRLVEEQYGIYTLTIDSTQIK